MRDSDVQKFTSWYDENFNTTFDFNHEIDKYCKMDVEILRQGCVKFRNIFYEYTTVDAFQSCTIASAVMSVYRKLFLPENTIGLIPKHEYHI